MSWLKVRPVADGLNWVQSTNWNYITTPTIIEFIFVSWFSKYEKNQYKFSSVCGAHLTLSKISTSNELQLSVSKSKILLVLEHWVRNSNGLFWKFGSRSCLAWGSHSQNSPVLSPYPTLLRSTNWIYVSQVAYNPSSKQLWKANPPYLLLGWEAAELAGTHWSFPYQLAQVAASKRLSNGGMQILKITCSVGKYCTTYMPKCISMNKIIWQSHLFIKKLSHQKNKSPGTIQNSMKILENPKPNCFFQINTTR